MKIIKKIFLITILFGLFSFANGQDNFLISTVNQNNLVGSDLLVLLLELKSIDLEADIFNSPVFKSLGDFSVKIEQQPAGRSNPFSPIGVDSNVSVDLEPVQDILSN